MRILVIADPHIPVPPLNYGGAERTIAMLCSGLVERGHTVDLMAGGGSQRFGNGRLYLHRAPSLAKASRAFRKIRFQLQSLWIARSADLIVNFGRCDYLWALKRLRTPLVVVFQNPAHQAEIDWVLGQRRNAIRFVGVSKAQMSGLAPTELIEVVHNVSDPAAMIFNPTPSQPPYFAFLGRLTANKGVHLAIEAARRAGVRLKIAGNVSQRERGAREYFERCVEPELRDGVEWIGPVNDEQKSKLLGGATALLFPIQWNEPCALVLPESLACGCPVIAWRNGCTPEIIRHGETGYLVDSVDQMVDAINTIGSIDRRTCRLDAEQRFSADAMVDGYIDVFNKLPSA